MRSKPHSYFRSLLTLLSLLLFASAGVESISLYAALSTRTLMPDFTGVTAWINSEPLSRNSLQGKIVLIEFWDFGNPKSIERIPALREWSQKYEGSGLVVVGVHSPIYTFEKDLPSVRSEVERLRIPYPVAVDSEKNLYNIYTPAKTSMLYLVDTTGRIRSVEETEGNYFKIEEKIRTLISETRKPPKVSLTAQASTPQGITSNFIFNYRNLSGVGNGNRMRADVAQTFQIPSQIFPDKFYLNGLWKLQEEAGLLVKAPGRITSIYKGPRVWLLAGTRKSSLIPVEIKLDGLPLTKENKGRDVVLQDTKSYVFLKEPRIYKLISTPNDVSEKKLEFSFEDSGGEIYLINFG